MRSLSAFVLVIAGVAAGCGDNGKQNQKLDGGFASYPDSSTVSHDDAKVFEDAPASTADGIAAAKATADGMGLTLAIHGVTVTYLKPQLGSTTNDPAGFTIQHDAAGPALFIAVDPATLTPVPVVGDVVDFTITQLLTVQLQKRATAITDFARTSQGADVTALATDVSAATDLVSALDSYDSRVLKFTGTLIDDVGASGSMFSKFTLGTAGIPSNTNLQFRIPTTLVTSAVMTFGCTVAATALPMSRFTATAEIQAFDASQFTLTCAPILRAAVAQSSTTVVLTFNRTIDPTSVSSDASQFTLAGLTLSNPVVAGNTVTLTTTVQVGAMAYTVGVDATIKDAQGNTATAAATANFTGFVGPATVKINEINANMANSCDIIELRVIADGSMAGFKITERLGTGSGDLAFTFPAGFSVHKNDYILIHESSTSATCNPNMATSETVTKSDQSAGAFMNNVDTAFDFWVTDGGITSSGTNNVITLYDPTSAIVDAVFLTQDPAATTGGSSLTLTQAAAVAAAGQWTPAMTTYTQATFNAAAVSDIDGTGATMAGTSIQRTTDTDTNAAADWTTGAGVASTWGANNVGQTDIP